MYRVQIGVYSLSRANQEYFLSLFFDQQRANDLIKWTEVATGDNSSMYFKFQLNYPNEFFNIPSFLLLENDNDCLLISHNVIKSNLYLFILFHLLFSLFKLCQCEGGQGSVCANGGIQS